LPWTSNAAPGPGEPLSAEVETFWNGTADRIEDACGVVEIPRVPAALPRRLGGFPFWRGVAPFLDTLGATYAKASPRGLDVFLGPAASSEGEHAGAGKNPRP
jgi:hypothetical protein